MPYWVCEEPDPTFSLAASASISDQVHPFCGKGTPAFWNSFSLYMMTVASASLAKANTWPTPNGAPLGGM